MLSRSIRASRPIVARLSRQSYVVTTTARTIFTPTAIRSADLVQDMYLRELKNYKPPAVKPSDAEGHVQKFNIPKPPRSPEESDIASELKAYETQSVELEGQSAVGESAVVEDWFEEDAEELEGESGPASAH